MSIPPVSVSTSHVISTLALQLPPCLKAVRGNHGERGKAECVLCELVENHLRVHLTSHDGDSRCSSARRLRTSRSLRAGLCGPSRRSLFPNEATPLGWRCVGERDCVNHLDMAFPTAGKKLLEAAANERAKRVSEDDQKYARVRFRLGPKAGKGGRSETLLARLCGLPPAVGPPSSARASHDCAASRRRRGI